MSNDGTMVDGILYTSNRLPDNSNVMIYSDGSITDIKLLIDVTASWIDIRTVDSYSSSGVPSQIVFMLLASHDS